MRTITEIKPKDKKRFVIYLDGKLAFVLYKSELRSFGLAVGQELNDKDYNDIVSVILPKRALLRLGHLLEKRDYTERQLRDKLIEAYYPVEAIDYAIAKVKGYGFVNDISYAERFIESKINRISMKAIRNKLFQKGINKADIETAFQHINENDIVQDEGEMIEKLLVKRHYYESDRTAKEKSKQYNYLMSKGFSSESIIKKLNL